jgi:hypothetical protein
MFTSRMLFEALSLALRLPILYVNTEAGHSFEMDLVGRLTYRIVYVHEDHWRRAPALRHRQ